MIVCINNSSILLSSSDFLSCLVIILSTVVCIWFIEVFISNISTWLVFLIYIPLLNFFFVLLTFLSSSWIDFLTSFLFNLLWGHWSFFFFYYSYVHTRLGSFYWSFLTVDLWITSHTVLLIHYPWIQMLSCCGSLDMRQYLGFSYLNFYTVNCTSVALSFLLLPCESG
jgi:hypothetical protein